MPFEFFPNTNFHDLNLDYILEKAQKIDDNLRDSQASADAAKASEEAAAASEAAAQASEDAAAEYLSSIGTTTSGIVNDWIENNLSQETGYVLDRSLTVNNAASPADIVGDYVGVSALNATGSPVQKILDIDFWSKNGIAPSTGIDVNNGYNYRTDIFLSVLGVTNISVENKSSTTYVVRAYFYDASRTILSTNYWTLTENTVRYFTTIPDGAVYVRFMISDSSYSILTDEQIADIKANLTIQIRRYGSLPPAILINRPGIDYISPVITINKPSCIIDFPSNRYARLAVGNRIYNIAGKSIDASSGLSEYCTIWFDTETEDFVLLNGAMSQNTIAPTWSYFATVYSADGLDINSVNGALINGRIHAGHPDYNSFSGHRTISVLGDSISTFEGYSESSDATIEIGGVTYTYWGSYYPHSTLTDVDSMYWKKLQLAAVASATPTISAVSRSRFRDDIFSQTGICSPAFWRDDRITRILSNSPDLIIINGGTNDCFGWRDVDGELPNTKVVSELEALPETTARGVFLTLAKIIARNTSALIIGVIPKYAESADFNFLNYEKMCNTLVQCYNAFGVPIVDLRDSGISANNVSNYTFDKIHPNINGMDEMYKTLYKRLVEIF